VGKFLSEIAWLSRFVAASALLIFSDPVLGQTGGIVVKNSVTFIGNSVVVDSYNSVDTNFSTGGLYDASKAKDNGDILCNGTTVGCVALGNASVFGHVVTAPNGTATTGSQGAIGSHVWQTGNKGIEPNGTEGQIWYSHNANIVLPDIAAPFFSGSTPGGPVDIVSGNPGSYVTNHYDHSLLGATYYYSGNLSGNTIVLNASQLYLPNGLTGTETFTIATNARLDLFVGGTACTLGPITNQGGFSTNFTLWALGSVATLNWPISSTFIGTIYAPDTAITVTPSGGPTYHISGSLFAKSVAASGRVQFHYDESIGGVWSQAPFFSTQPQNQSVSAGQDALFTATISGASPITYQWRLNGSTIAGATNTNLLVTNCAAGNAGDYSLLASNNYGVATSSNAVLTVNFPPSILRQPVSQSAVLSSNTAFTVTASGTTLAYQWRFNGQNLPGATNSLLAIAGMQASNAGIYTVVVTNIAGSVTSDIAGLTVATPPEFLWARRTTNQVNGYIGISYGKHLAIDSSGNVFVAGSYANYAGVDFGGAVLTNDLLSLGATFVCKYDQWGNFGWARQIATNLNNDGLKVATDPTGNVYVVGDFSGTVTFGTNAITAAPGAQEMFVAKYDGQGQALWARRIAAYDQSSGGDGRGIAVDGAGNVFILAPYSWGTADFGTTNVSDTAAFLAKYDTAGNLIWAKGVLPGAAVCVGQSGSIYTCGLMMMKYDSGGNLAWSRPFADARCMVLDDAENIYASGMGNGTYGDLTITNVGSLPDFFVAKCDSAGNLIWSRQMGSTKEQTGIAIALDTFQNVYVSSASASAEKEALLTFGSTTLTNVDSLLAKYDQAGNPLWAKSLGGTNRADPFGLAVLNPGAVFAAGTLYGTGQFGNFILTPENLQGMYVARLAGIEPPALPQIIGQPQDQTVRAGSTAAFNVTTVPSGIPLSYQWYFNGTNAVPGEGASALIFTNAQMSTVGNYQVSVANTYGSVTSSVAALTVYLTEAATLGSFTAAIQTNQVQFQVAGVAGFKYAVEASTNLIDWVRLSTNTAPYTFVDDQAANFQLRFYRVVWVQ
jgi:hypothetical protein